MPLNYQALRSAQQTYQLPQSAQPQARQQRAQQAAQQEAWQQPQQEAWQPQPMDFSAIDNVLGDLQARKSNNMHNALISQGLIAGGLLAYLGFQNYRVTQQGRQQLAQDHPDAPQPVAYQRGADAWGMVIIRWIIIAFILLVIISGLV